MGFITIDPELQKSEEIANYFSFLMSSTNIEFPKLSLLQILSAKVRQGLDSDVTSNSIISRFPEAGLPNGPLENGSPNALEILIKIIVEELFDSIQSEMRVDVAVDPGIIVTSAGASAAGPVTTTGSNISPASATGIAS